MSRKERGGEERGMPPVASREFESEQRSPEPRFSLSFSFVSLFLRQRLSSARSHTSAPRVAFLLVVVCIANVGKRVPPDRERENSLERVPKKLKHLIDDDDDEGHRPVVARLPPGAFSRCLPLSLTEATPRVGHKRKRERERGDGAWRLRNGRDEKKTAEGKTLTTPRVRFFLLNLDPHPLSLSLETKQKHIPLKARYVDAMAVSARAAEAGKSLGEAVSAGVSAALAPRLTRVVFHAGGAMAPALNAAAAIAAAPARKKASAAAATTAAAAAATVAPATAAPLSPVEGLLVRVLPSPSASSVAVGDVVAFRAPAVSPEEARAVGAWPSEGQAEVRV